MTLYRWHRERDILRLIRKNDRKVNIWTRQRLPENANKGVVI